MHLTSNNAWYMGCVSWSPTNLATIIALIWFKVYLNHDPYRYIGGGILEPLKGDRTDSCHDWQKHRNIIRNFNHNNSQRNGQSWYTREKWGSSNKCYRTWIHPWMICIFISVLIPWKIKLYFAMELQQVIFWHSP